jgi:hypothetical protein
MVMETLVNNAGVETKEVKQVNENGKFARFAHFASGISDEVLSNTKTIPAEVYQNLPDILKKCTSVFELQREKDVFLTGAIGVLSGCFNTVTGLYASEEYHPNLNCFVVAPPSSGKGRMKYARVLANAIHDEKLSVSKESWSNYLRRNTKKSNLPEPEQKLLFIPANSSASAVIRHLNENNESGIICETEADTMSDTFKQDWGGYSDLIRKAFHHETVSSSRKKDREYYELKHPKLSVVLSGTPDQVKTLIHSSENGLFSRMIFYAFDGIESWKSVAPTQGRLNLNRYFEKLSDEIKSIYDKYSGRQYEFDLTESQWKELDDQFSNWLNEITTFIHQDTASIVKRLGLIQFRIAMILSILRHNEDNKEETTITCSDLDFKSAQLLSNVYLDHALTMFFKLPRESRLAINKKIKTFFDSLPENTVIKREDAVNIGRKNQIQERTVDKYLKRLLGINYLEQPEYGKYKKA